MNGPQLLRAWRGERSLVAASRVIDCDPSTLSLLENGRRKPGRDLALRLQEHAGVPVTAWSEGGAQPPTVAATMTPVNAPASGDSGMHPAVDPDAPADGEKREAAAGTA